MDTAADLYASGKSIHDVADALGTNYSRARKHLLAAGVVLRTKAAGTRLAGPKLAALRRGKKRTFTAAWRKNISVARQRHANKHALGVSLKPSGYLEFTRGPNKGRAVHVVVLEEHIGRPLADDEVVHHIDGDRLHNDVSNLLLMTRAAHSAHHGRELHARRRRAPNGRFA